MSSQFFGLEIAYSGLQAYNAALNTTANNIANVETKGYSRQRTVQTAAAALRTRTSYGMAGAGVSVSGVEQVRNAYYDIKYRNAATSLGEYSTKANYMKQIENYFNDDGDKILGFNSIYNTFFTSLEDLENNPSDDSTRIAFLGSAQQLTEYFNSMYEDLQSLQEDSNTAVKDAVNQIDALASQIASLNKQINIIEIQGLTANELRDQRNNLVDELSQYVDVEIVEDEMCNNNNPDEPLGIYRYQVYISGGLTLVDGYEYRELECVSRVAGDKINQSDADGLYDIRWKDTAMNFYPVGAIYSGSLSALLQVRDGNNNESFKGEISAFADNTVSVKISDKDAAYEYLKTLEKCTLNNSGTIVLNGVSYKYNGWSFTENSDGVTYSFNLLEDQPDGADVSDIAGFVGGAARVGKGVNYQGIPYYMEQMNEWLRGFAKTFDDKLREGSDGYGNAMTLALFTANPENPEDGKQFSFIDEGNTTKKSTDDNYYRLTAGNAAINSEILKDVRLLATTYMNGDIEKENADLLKDVSAIKTDKNMWSFRGCSSQEFLSCVLGDIALNASSANNFMGNFENIEKSITEQRLSVSGVDDDEEALDLVKFQNAYNLSAKMIQIMTEIYDRLILETGV